VASHNHVFMTFLDPLVSAVRKYHSVGVVKENTDPSRCSVFISQRILFCRDKHTEGSNLHIQEV